MRKTKRDLTSIEFAVLGLIKKGIRYGYEIFKAMSDKQGLGQIWISKPGNLYALLEKMASRGMITASISQSGNRPARKEYQLSEQGEKAFQLWCSSVVTHPRQMRQDFFARWFFFSSNPQAVQVLFLKQMDECNAWENGILEKTKLNDKNWFEMAIYKFRLGQIRAMKDWLFELQRGEK